MPPETIDVSATTQPVTVQEPPRGSMAIERRGEVAITPRGVFGDGSPAQVIAKATEAATALKDVIRAQGLISNISGKEYPKCEAWTLLGTMIGVFPVLAWTKPVEGGWEARVEARTRDGAIVGAAEAQCLKSERNWANRDDFAIRSMAQTRATAKCLRMPLGFVMTLAGYEATPAEEMPTDGQNTRNGPRTSQKPTAATSRPPAAQTPQAKPATQQATPANKPPPPSQPQFASDGTRAHLIRKLQAAGDEVTALDYFLKLDKPCVLIPGESLQDIPLEFVPLNKAQFEALESKIRWFGDGNPAEHAFPPNSLPEAEKKKRAERTSKPAAPAKPIEVPRDANLDPNSPDAPWRSFPMPFGKEAGRKLADLDKKYLFGLWANFKASDTWTGDDGRIHKTKPDRLPKDRKLREMLDQAGLHYEFNAPAGGDGPEF